MGRKVIANLRLLCCTQRTPSKPRLERIHPLLHFNLMFSDRYIDILCSVDWMFSPFDNLHTRVRARTHTLLALCSFYVFNILIENADILLSVDLEVFSVSHTRRFIPDPHFHVP